MNHSGRLFCICNAMHIYALSSDCCSFTINKVHGILSKIIVII
jgi:hypothetical protein